MAFKRSAVSDSPWLHQLNQILIGVAHSTLAPIDTKRKLSLAAFSLRTAVGTGEGATRSFESGGRENRVRVGQASRTPL